MNHGNRILGIVMEKRITLRMAFLVALAILIGFAPGMAQQPSNGNVKIEVRKQQNGQVDVQKDSRSLDEVGSLQDLLDQYGAKEELGDLQPGEEVEIIIRRRKKADVVREMIVELDSDRPIHKIEEKAKRPLLGVYYEEDEKTGGGRVNGLIPNSAAEGADIQKGDIIIQLDKEVIQGLASLQNAVKSHKAGDKVKVVLLRDGKKISKNVTLGEDNHRRFQHMGNGTDFHWEQFNGNNNEEIIFAPKHGGAQKFHFKSDEDMAGRPMLGVTLNINRTVIDNGNGDRQDETNIKVQSVLPNSAAADMGMENGDKILSVNGQQINGINDIRTALDGAKKGDNVTATVERNGNMKKLSGKMTDLKHKGQHKVMDFDFDTDVNINGIEIEELKRLEELKNLEDVHFFDGSNGERVIIKHIETDDNTDGEVREFHMVISLSDVTTEEAQALSAASGEDFSGQSSLEMARFEVGPNPNNGLFKLSFELPSQGETQIRVLDLNGEEVYRENLGNFQGRYDKDFDISKFSKGVYFLQITQGDRAFTKKVVTQ
jgi:membrane-associated protease RseP (regulator of RpoE activity)